MRSAPRGGTSPTHRPLAGHEGPDSLSRYERLARIRAATARPCCPGPA